MKLTLRAWIGWRNIGRAEGATLAQEMTIAEGLMAFAQWLKANTMATEVSFVISRSEQETNQRLTKTSRTIESPVEDNFDDFMQGLMGESE